MRQFLTVAVALVAIGLCSVGADAFGRRSRGCQGGQCGTTAAGYSVPAYTPSAAWAAPSCANGQCSVPQAVTTARSIPVPAMVPAGYVTMPRKDVDAMLAALKKVDGWAEPCAVVAQQMTDCYGDTDGPVYVSTEWTEAARAVMPAALIPARPKIGRDDCLCGAAYAEPANERHGLFHRMRERRGR